jgi:carbonic anhydrase/acetyltransferase-like protein (isoleucine patch superfamily)
MALFEFEGKQPLVADGAFVHPEATVMGLVALGEGCHIGHERFCGAIVVISSSVPALTSKRAVCFMSGRMR